MPINDALSHNYRTSLDNVPAEAQESIKLVTDLAGRFFTKSLAMVWLFGSYARGEAINDKRVNQETGTLSEYRSDIDILVVVRDVLPQNTEEEKTNFDLLNKAYVDARYKTDYDVDIAVLDDLITRISAFQVWVYERCLVEIDKMVLLDGYSEDCAVVRDYLDLVELKKRELPQAVVVRQLGEIRAAEVREKDEREGKEAALDKFDKEREDKEAALQEKDRLRQKLLDAGIDPDGV
jgi:predicted nucleotidyltransferase